MYVVCMYVNINVYVLYVCMHIWEGGGEYSFLSFLLQKSKGQCIHNLNAYGGGQNYNCVIKLFIILL